MADSKETGQLAYEGYKRAKGGYDGEILMMEWDELSSYEQDAWWEAAHAAIQKGWVEAARSSDEDNDEMYNRDWELKLKTRWRRR